MLDAVERRLQVDALDGQLQRQIVAVARLAEAGRQRLGLQQLARPQHDRALDDVLQLTDVARPVVLLEHGQGLRRHAPRRPAHLLRQLLDEVGDQQRDVLAAIAQRRQVERDDVETVEEILAQDALGDGAPDVAVRGGDEADVDLDVAGVAHPTDLPLLDGAEQLDLHGLGDLGDLVEKERRHRRRRRSPRCSPRRR